jgi:hypothetical protein
VSPAQSELPRRLGQLQADWFPGSESGAPEVAEESEATIRWFRVQSFARRRVQPANAGIPAGSIQRAAPM